MEVGWPGAVDSAILSHDDDLGSKVSEIPILRLSELG